jgi:hypothetical protein
MPTYTLRDDDPALLRMFIATLDGKAEKTIAAYLATLRDLVAWLATQPDSMPFQPALLTVTALGAISITSKPMGARRAHGTRREPRSPASAVGLSTRACSSATAS